VNARTGSLIAVVASAVGSLALMLYAGRNNQHYFLTVLFTIWVLAPFVALVVATHVASRRWPVFAGGAFRVVMLLIAIGSFAAYLADALGPPKAKAAFVFVAVPGVSWLLIALTVATLIARKQ
jgi:hypothetical protein